MGMEEPEDGGPGEDEGVPDEGDDTTPRIPPDDPAEDDQKRFMVRREDGALVVSVSGSSIGRLAGPARLLGELASSIADVVKAFNGGEPQLYEVRPGNSMVFVFDDPEPEAEQEKLGLSNTLAAAEVVSDLLELGGEELYERALELTPVQVRTYRDFARLVQTEDIELIWQPRTRAARTLEPTRAGIQYSSLDREPELKGHEMAVNGVLYRVIEHPIDKTGTIGIALFKWSRTPPGAKAPGMLIIEFERAELHSDIKRLLGGPVEAIIDIQQPIPGRSVDPERKRIVLRSIRAGEPETSKYGTSFDEIDPGEWQR